ncbi:helix-turn-helix domain-containing protein [Longispora albida]|uniref:helix-turn-helix domain-containing protein n=1 Tax=Longispora albida TaxID=203523 RepID=UPI00037A80E7|nr:XRE family transcriptional regulator [Longispora albida]
MNSDQEPVAQAIAAHLKELRALRGWSLDELATRSGVSRGMLIQIEQARTNPSVGTLVRVSQALGVTLAQLVVVEQSPIVRLTRAADTVRLWQGTEGGHAQLVIGSDPPNSVELWSWVMYPGEVYQGEALPGTRELLTVTEGPLTLDVGGEEQWLAAGDAVAFRSDRSHEYRVEGRTPARFTCAVIRPA